MRKGQTMEIRFSRVASAIGSIPFAAITYVLADALFIGRLNIGNLERGFLECILFALFGFGLLWCVKTAVFPSLMFAWDTSGVRIGRGVFVNRIITVAWAHVLDIKETKMQVTVQRSNRTSATRHKF